MTVYDWRMQQRGGTEAEILSSGDVPLEREIVVAADTGSFWVGNGIDAPSGLPKQGPAVVDPATGLTTLPSGALVPTVDLEMQQLPDAVRARIAANLADASTPEGAAIAEAIANGGGGAAPLTYDDATGLYTVPEGSALAYDSASGLYTTN